MSNSNNLGSIPSVDPASYEVLPPGSRSLLERINEALTLPRGPMRDAMLEAVRGELSRLVSSYFGR